MQRKQNELEVMQHEELETLKVQISKSDDKYKKEKVRLIQKELDSRK